VKALISVYNKSNLDLLLPTLQEAGYELISSGGTARYIRELGYEVSEVSTLTEMPELLDGRVKTLHPKILAGILARKNYPRDLEELAKHNLPEFDLVVVNLYPFATVSEIENIDIGGVTLLRSAAKNFEHITVLSNPNQYAKFNSLITNQEELNKWRLDLATEVFQLTAQYDLLISQYLANRSKQDSDLPLPKTINLQLSLEQKLRYGENPQQKASLYRNPLTSGSLSGFRQLQGKEISFNNILDMHSAYKIVNEYDSKVPCVAIVKHNNPCGVAIAPSIAQAYLDALNEMINIFLELIIAPSFSAEALEILSSKPNLRLISTGEYNKSNKEFDIKYLDGLYLLQEFDDIDLDPNKIEIVTKKQIEEHQWVDLLLAWRVAKHCKSNAVVAVLNGKTIGIGCGQTNRIKAVTDALSNCDFDNRQAVMASDGFFPFADSIDIAAKNNISAIIQPGGSIRDKEVIEACDKSNIAMVFSKQRCFKH
jgi:phosphoribosylaminoimidazolecarboxamide formyltransferase / IMP cyclohydrolase